MRAVLLNRVARVAAANGWQRRCVREAISGSVPWAIAVCAATPSRGGEGSFCEVFLAGAPS